MTDSDITGNITADCGQVPQKQEMIEGHEVGCTCDCCQLSESICQDNLDQCEQAQQPSGGMKRMKGKLTPIMANCAVLLAIFALSGLVARAGNIRSSDTIHINPAIDTQIANSDIGIVITDINHAAIIRGVDVIEANDIQPINTNIVGVAAIEITNLNSQIGEIAIGVENTVVEVDEAISPVYRAGSNYTNASVNRDILSAIRK
jgi:hypothetical protein